jgi:hypothetical protein
MFPYVVSTIRGRKDISEAGQIKSWEKNAKRFTGGNDAVCFTQRFGIRLTA